MLALVREVSGDAGFNLPTPHNLSLYPLGQRECAPGGAVSY